MAEYTFIGETRDKGVINNLTGMIIPATKTNRFWNEFIEWEKQGNVADSYIYNKNLIESEYDLKIEEINRLFDLYNKSNFVYTISEIEYTFIGDNIIFMDQIAIEIFVKNLTKNELIPTKDGLFEIATIDEKTGLPLMITLTCGDFFKLRSFLFNKIAKNIIVKNKYLYRLTKIFMKKSVTIDDIINFDITDKWEK